MKKIFLLLSFIVSLQALSQRGIQGHMTVGWRYDVDALSFITATGLTDAVQKGAVSTLAKDYKQAGLWTLRYGIWPMMGGTATTCKYNLKDPRDLDAALRITFVNSPTFSSNGVDWNGTTQYGDPHFNPSFLTTTTSLLYYSRENANTGTDQVDFGGRNGGNSNWLSAYYSGTGLNKSFGQNGVNLLTGNASSSAACFEVTKTGTTAAFYRDGVSLATTTDATAAINALMYLGAYNNNGSPGLYTNRQCAGAAAGDGVDATKAALEYAAWQKFNTTLSRQN